MKHPLRLCLALLATFALASCSPPEIKIAVTKANDQIVVGLTQDWGIIFSGKEAPCVDRIYLHRPGSRGETGTIVWRVEANTNQCVKLSSFVLGRTPVGFKQVVPLPASSHGTFTITVWGIGVGETQLTLR
jgi:hypothetical protein